VSEPIKLSEEQHSVVNHRAGHLQVIACAGAGKTEAISRRILSLILEGVEPSQIIAFTFTERAAESLKTRIFRRVAEAKGEGFLDRLGPMYVGTIHAYCLRMLQDHVPAFGNFDILDENRLAGLLSREYRRLDLVKLGNSHWRPILDFKRNADVIENELIDIEAIASTPFGQCYSNFKKTLHRYHFLTYGLLVSAAVKALNRPEVRQKVCGGLRHLIVDEYQDVNPAQEKLVNLLVQDHVNLCVVADDDQSIYQWRGSDVQNMLTFDRRYPGVTALTLSANRRSRPEIVKSANLFAETISPRLKKEMRFSREDASPQICGWASETDDEEAEVIADTIDRLHAQGFRYKDIAVLYRSVRTSSIPLVEALKARDIPFSCAGRTGLFLQPEAALLGSVYAFLCDRDWKNERFSQSAPVKLEDLLHDFQAIFNKGEPIEGLQSYLTGWKQMTGDRSHQINLIHDYYKLLRIVGINQLDLDSPIDSSRLGTLARFSQILADFEHVTRRSRYVDEAGTDVFRGGQDRGVDFYRQLYNYLQHYALDAYEDFQGEDNFDLDAVDITTIHQSKGLEWPIVFIPCLVKGRFPSSNTGKTQNWLLDDNVFPQHIRQRYEGTENDERRLFYVALTRARDTVYLSRFRRKTNQFHPSPFLLEVLGGEPPILDTLPIPGRFTPEADGAADLPTISFSEMASYERCPLKYRFTSSLGFQPQLVAELGYGKAVHHILRLVAEKTKQTQSLPDLQEVQELINREFYLPFANKAAFENLIQRAASLVTKYLGEYSHELLRVWETERPFALHLEKGVINGRADVILDQEQGVTGKMAIVDYKTANDPQSDDIFAFQLAVYTAAGRGEGLDVAAAYLHSLKDSDRKPVPVDNIAVNVARRRADTLIEGIVAKQFPARPQLEKCKICDMRAICKHAICGKYDIW
jgi:DNA helicase-2/ATP-dependent DNA helicase PcrA